MAFNKITYHGNTVMDISDSTVTPETLGKDVIAYAANGDRIVGVGGGVIEVDQLPTESIDTNAFYLCKGKYYKYDASVWHEYLYPVNELRIANNGQFDIKKYASVLVNVPRPSGSTEITENGSYNVADFEEAVVNVPGVIEVETLPIEKINTNSIYKCRGMYYEPTLRCDGAYFKHNDEIVNIMLAISIQTETSAILLYAETRPTENIKAVDTENKIIPVYYIEDENQLLSYADGAWINFIGAFLGNIPVSGIVNSISELIEVPDSTLWMLMSVVWTQYSNNPPVITVAELPTENINPDALYKCGNDYYESKINFAGIYMIVPADDNNELLNLKDALEAEGMTLEAHYVKTKPTDDILEWDGESTTIPAYYVDDVNDLLVYMSGAWMSFLNDIMQIPLTISGKVSDISELADKPSETLWAVVGNDGWNKYSLAS